ncbi:methylated-DNA-[protein]-cysteine S-methyltransferase [Paraburkholderia unamae]|uniref:Methylated-DNA-[protein]-cysteine S-methyltransferase n=2 Tax=Paraburkholderia unamae TaxID=219649 RepID=A0ABX5KK99_9BURK|nr:methylated-DNA-[protein]-cysteine S-methyltransferase [Paraburkholderia unamae]RAR60517.1 methylated-DNA-[protein]-cysteine S-methyltransferase [Paraburkholderia unamae]CAG9272412.1 Methylated-DNA--protein-cysteine methyltransferase [Paraburkholderia unamae]
MSDDVLEIARATRHHGVQRSRTKEATMFNAVIAAPFGKVGIRASGEALREIVYLPAQTAGVEPDCELAARAAGQIERYFENADAAFDLPLALSQGTAFQRRVWDGICSIAAGDMLTYGELAKRIGSVSPRAVGQACGDNPFPIVIPCHRVVSASGIGGFAHHGGEGFFRDVKRWLLAHECTANRFELR